MGEVVMEDTEEAHANAGDTDHDSNKALEAAVGEADEGQPGTCEKSDLVCKHWITKGVCRYESTCRFQHPESALMSVVKTSKQPKWRRGRASEKEQKSGKHAAERPTFSQPPS